MFISSFHPVLEGSLGSALCRQRVCASKVLPIFCVQHATASHGTGLHMCGTRPLSGNEHKQNCNVSAAVRGVRVCVCVTVYLGPPLYTHILRQNTQKTEEKMNLTNISAFFFSHFLQIAG